MNSHQTACLLALATILNLTSPVGRTAELGETPVTTTTRAELSIAQVRKIQSSLRNLGYDAGPADGVYGPLTSRAVVQFQADKGLTLSGYPDGPFLSRLRKEARALSAAAE